MSMEPGSAILRIGELSRRLGVSTHVLRAWERRYGVLSPVRSEGGYRLYSAVDEHRIRLMQAHLARGLSAAEAAQAALREAPASSARASPDPSTAGEVLGQVLEAFDEPSAQDVLDRLLTEFTTETLLRDVLLPYLHGLGERWARGEITVAQEHFATNVVRARVVALGRGWGRGLGPRALLACPPGERHDISLLTFGVALHRRGWRISYIGADTPMADLIHTAAAEPPQFIVLSAVDSVRFAGLEPDLRRLAGIAPLALAGCGATEETARAVGARLLAGDPVTEAENLTSP